MTASTRPEVWFLTGSQGLYGEETLSQVAEQSRRIQEQLDAAPGRPATLVWKPVLTDSAAIMATVLAANADPSCIGLIVWMHTFSPAKMWIAGLDLLRKPLLHLHTQANVELPWSTIDMDFMNLNQAAHGDREFGYIQSRLRVARKTVSGHSSDPAVVAVFTPGCVPRSATARCVPCGWPGSATTCATWRSPRGTRSRPNSGSGCRSTPTV